MRQCGFCNSEGLLQSNRTTWIWRGWHRGRTQTPLSEQRGRREENFISVQGISFLIELTNCESEWLPDDVMSSLSLEEYRFRMHDKFIAKQA